MPRLISLSLWACVASLWPVSCGASDHPPAVPSAKANQPPAAAEAAASAQPAGPVEVGEFIIGEPVQHQNLTVFPVSSKQPKHDDQYLTLDEGLKAGTVEVSEVGAQPSSGRRTAPRPPQVDDDPFSEPAAALLQPPVWDPYAASAPLPAQPRVKAKPSRREAQPPRQTPRRSPAAEPLAGADSDDPFGPPLPPKPAAPKTAPTQTQVASDPFSADPFAAPAQPAQIERQAQQVAAPRLGGGPDVNRLIVVNRSEKPLYLMPGEVIYGGQQDRTIAEETIVPADGQPVAIPVYCVEHGRWAFRPDRETLGALNLLSSSSGRKLDEQQLQKLADDAKQGKFVAPAGSLGKGARVAVQDGKGQHEVWNKVGEANAASGVRTRSGAFTANYTHPEFLKELQAYTKAVETPVAGRQQVVGAIVAIDGKPQAIDIFQSTPLFRKLWPKLLQSHALDAVSAARRGAARGKTAVCTLADAQQFLQAVMQANVEQTRQSQTGLVVTKRETRRVISFSAATEPAPADARTGMGGFGGGLHSSGYAK
jgi:hypothetical protein